MLRAVVVLLAFILFSGAVASDESTDITNQSGHLCLAAAPTPTPGEPSLANPTGGLPDVAYSVRVDGQQAVLLSRSSGIWVSDLPLNDRHLVAILADGKQIESFYFHFRPEAPELCLFMKSLYRTWILWPLEKTGEATPLAADGSVTFSGGEKVTIDKDTGHIAFVPAP